MSLKTIATVSSRLTIFRKGGLPIGFLSADRMADGSFETALVCLLVMTVVRALGSSTSIPFFP
jgi:hypothetical protein